jgi:hypothetical protein
MQTSELEEFLDVCCVLQYYLILAAREMLCQLLCYVLSPEIAFALKEFAEIFRLLVIVEGIHTRSRSSSMLTIS